MPCPLEYRHFDRLDQQSIDASGWLPLFENVSDARFFHHPDWFLAIDQHLARASLTLSVVKKNNAPVALFTWQSSTNLRRRATPEHDHLSLGDALIHADLTPDEKTDAIDIALTSNGHRVWDWQFHNVPARSPLFQATRRQAYWHSRHTRTSAWFDLQAETAPPGAKLKRNLKRLLGKLSLQGNVALQWVFAKDELPSAFAHFARLEASGWKASGRQSTAIAHNPALLRFYEQLLTPRYPGLQPVITLLWLDDHCIAAQYALQTGTTLSLLKIAYDQNYASFSPGSLLLQKVIGVAIERQLDTVSLVTSPAWAERWHPLSEPVWHVTRYANNAGGVALRTLDHLKQTLRARLKPDY